MKPETLMFKFWVIEDTPDDSRQFMSVFAMKEEEFLKLKQDLTTVGNVAELVACCQDFEELYTFFCQWFAAPGSVVLADPASRSFVRQSAEMLLIKMCMFTHSLNTLLRRMDSVVADEFKQMQQHAWEHQKSLILAKMMRNYLEHFYRLPTKFIEDHRDGKEEWSLLLKSDKIIRAAEEDNFRLQKAPKEILLEEGDIDIGEVCVVGSVELLNLSREIPFATYLDESVRIAIQKVKAFLQEIAPDGRDLFVSRPLEDEPKRHIPIDLNMLEVVGRACDLFIDGRE